VLLLVGEGVNLGDKMFQGIYNDKQKHDPDFDKVLLRAQESGVVRMIGELCKNQQPSAQILV
jgi:TatD DNase family protein